MADEVQLVTMNSSHLAATLDWLGDPSFRRQLDSLDVPTDDGNAAYWQARWADQHAESYAVVDASGQHVGNCGLRGIDRRRRKAELWIYLGRHRDSGLGSGAVELLLRRAFDELDLNRVYLRVVAHNTGALRFYCRLGFVPEGRWREDTWWDGQPVDSEWFSMLAREYRARHTAGA